MSGVVAWCQRVAEDRRFQGLIVAAIRLNALLVGLETSDEVVLHYGALLDLLTW